MTKPKCHQLNNRQSGMLLVSILIITAVLTVIGFSLASLTISQYAISNNKVYSANALMVAEAGIEQALKEINEDETFLGHTTDQEFFNNQTQGRGTFTTTITNMSDTNAKQIISVGKVTRFNKTEVESSRTVKVTIVGTSSDGYSVHTGPGGLILGGSANITNSDVFVNGTITMGGSSKIGTHALPLNVNVAHNACPTANPPGPTYPQLCTSGQPISMDGSTKIYGSVCATNQTNNEDILPGSSGQGLILGCTAPPVSTPTYNRSSHVSAVSSSASGNNNSNVCKTWPANYQLTGNVNIGGRCEIVISGNAHITGNLSIGGSSRIRVADSLGTTRPVIVVDGIISTGGSSQLIANSSGTGIQFISFKSTAPCSPSCASVTGNDLKLSQALETVSIGSSVNYPGMVFQAYWGKIRIGGSGSIGAAIGQTVDMSGSGTVVFGTELSSGVRTWAITSYQQDFIDN